MCARARVCACVCEVLKVTDTLRRSMASIYMELLLTSLTYLYIFLIPTSDDFKMVTLRTLKVRTTSASMNESAGHNTIIIKYLTSVNLIKMAL